MSHITNHMAYTEASLSAQNTFSDVVQVSHTDNCSVSIQGSFSGTTVTVQAQWTDAMVTAGTWDDVKSYTAATCESMNIKARCNLRVGVKTGNYAAGPVTVRIIVN